MDFASWLRYCTNVVQADFALCLAIPWAGTLSICFWGLLPHNGILTAAVFTLRPSLAFFYISSIAAQRLCSVHQANFAEFSKGHHLYWAGRPSRWASAHILVLFYVSVFTDVFS